MSKSNIQHPTSNTQHPTFNIQTPAISDGQIFLRTDGHLYCIAED